MELTPHFASGGAEVRRDMGCRPDSDRTEPRLVSGQMDPDLFITIAFSSFVFVVGILALILMTVMVVRTHRRAEGPYEQEEPAATTDRATRRSLPRTPGQSHERRVHDRSRRSRVRI
jgi:hypothetical protein